MNLEITHICYSAIIHFGVPSIGYNGSGDANINANQMRFFSRHIVAYIYVAQIGLIIIYIHEYCETLRLSFSDGNITGRASDAGKKKAIFYESRSSDAWK